jgi:hypothetical protein
VKRRSRLVIAIALSGLAGCHHEGRSVGDLGRAEIGYEYITGIGLDRPLMAGGAEPICILPHSGASLPSPLGLHSDDTKVFETSSGDLQGRTPVPTSVFGIGVADPCFVATLHGRAAGEAELSLSDSETGDPFDTFTVRVAPARTISLDLIVFQDGAFERRSDIDEIVLARGQQGNFDFHVFTDTDEEIAAWHSVGAAVGDPRLAEVSGGFADDDPRA